MSTTQTLGKGHGRIEIRTAQSSELLSHWLESRGFGTAKQVIRIERVRRIQGIETRAVEYDLTSVDTTQATAFDLMTGIRKHGSIENQLHHVRDVTFDEDPSRVRKGNSAAVLAALRNVAIHLLSRGKAVSIRAASKAIPMRPSNSS